MKVINRNGDEVDLNIDRITDRNSLLAQGLNVNIKVLSDLVSNQIIDKMKTSEIDILSAEHAFHLSIYEPEYDKLAIKIATSNLHKMTDASFIKTWEKLLNNHNKILNIHQPLIKKNIYDFVKKYGNMIDSVIRHERDYNYNYFGFTTIGSYLLKSDIPIERPQHLHMRTAIFPHIPLTNIHGEVIEEGDIYKAIKTYELLSEGYYTHASPTLFNSCTPCSQVASCHVYTVLDDLKDIHQKLEYIGQSCKLGGGMGGNISKIRSIKSPILSTNGKSDGIIPMIKVYDSNIRYCNQSGRRKGTNSMTLEITHPEIVEFIQLPLKDGADVNIRALDTFIGLFIPDLFMERAKNDEEWCLFDPNKILHHYGKQFDDVYGEEFEKMYVDAESKKLYTTKMKARSLFAPIMKSQIQTGIPYILFKDAINYLSNHSNIGTIRGLNLCCEIAEHTGPKDLKLIGEVFKLTGNHVPHDSLNSSEFKKVARNPTIRQLEKGIITECKNINLNLIFYDDVNDDAGVCTLASISLPKFIINSKKKIFDFEKLGEVTKVIVENLDNIIDRNDYPTLLSRRTALEQRAIGIGVQGLADVFMIFDLAWEDEEAEELNSIIEECIYYHAVYKSCEIAKIKGSYPYFKNSKSSKGILHFDPFGIIPFTDEKNLKRKVWMPKLNWDLLREMNKEGRRNSLLKAQMPTATTSQILGNYEAREMANSVLYVRKTQLGEFSVINKHLYKKLKKLELWTKEIVDIIIKNNGSIQNIPQIPDNVKRVFKTVWEIKQRIAMKYAKQAQLFTCQSQSNNFFIKDINYKKLITLYYDAWNDGIKGIKAGKEVAKTGNYYIRNSPSEATKYTVECLDDCKSCSA